MNAATVISIYMSNISHEVVDAQRHCVAKYLPDGWNFVQYFHTPAKIEMRHHATAIASYIEQALNPNIILLDIDCIPLSSVGLHLLNYASDDGYLSGCVQRASHLQNNNHLYVGPFCMAFSKDQYATLGSPSFDETQRGDCGEELTYRWEERKQPIKYLWPSSVQYPMWTLSSGKVFGYGTTYQNLFYHAFCSREQHTRDLFLNKCTEVLNQKEEGVTV
jgi:hypothetical protein